MELTVLGCAGGYPGPEAACSGYLLSEADHHVWIDAGTGTLPQLLRYRALSELDAVWISHLHADHCSDLLGAFHYLAYGPDPRGTRLPMYGPPGLASAMDPLIDEPGGLAEVFEVRELADGMSFDCGPIGLRAVEVPHSIPTFALRAQSGGSIMSYSSDCGGDPAVTAVARDADLFVCEAFNAAGDTRFTSVKSPQEAGRYAALGGARRLLLTHLPPGADPDRARREAATCYDGPITVAGQGAVYKVG